MSERFSVEERSAQPALEVPATVAMFSIPKALGEGYAQINTCLKGASAELVGAPYARYLDIDWEKARNQGAFSQMMQLFFKKQRLCAGRLVSEPVAAQGNVLFKEIPAGRYVTAVHEGAFHKVGETYNAMTAWAAEQGITLVNHSMESYVTDPKDTATEDLRTNVSIRIAE